MQLRNFDLNLLITMEAIWATRSVSLAAKRLNLAQSTISAALNRLRDQLGDQIFVWSGHEMAPTPMGAQLMPQVVRILDEARSVLEQTHGEKADVERRVVIATVDYVVALYGAQLLTRASTEAPNVVFDVVNIRPQSIDRNSLPDIDFFICPLDALLRVAGLKHEPLYSDSYVCIGAKDNKKLYAGMPATDFLKLRHVGWSALPRVTFNHESMLWDDLDEEANYCLTMPNYLAFPRVVANSDAVAILPKRLAVTLMGEWRIKWIEPPVPVPLLEISQVWRPVKHADPTITWLRGALKDIVDDWSPKRI
jgi:LysR family transcriptional regulator, nod-box dependent transcriptional activator